MSAGERMPNTVTAVVEVVCYARLASQQPANTQAWLEV